MHQQYLISQQWVRSSFAKALAQGRDKAKSLTTTMFANNHKFSLDFDPKPNLGLRLVSMKDFGLYK